MLYLKISWTHHQQRKRLQERDTPVNQTAMTRTNGVFAYLEKEFLRFTAFMTTRQRTDNGLWDAVRSNQNSEWKTRTTGTKKHQRANLMLRSCGRELQMTDFLWEWQATTIINRKIASLSFSQLTATTGSSQIVFGMIRSITLMALWTGLWEKMK